MPEAARVPASDPVENRAEGKRDHAEHRRHPGFRGTPPERRRHLVELLFGHAVAFASSAENVEMFRQSAGDRVHLLAETIFVEFVAFRPGNNSGGENSGGWGAGDDLERDTCK